jgi:hypothetical protein
MGMATIVAIESDPAQASLAASSGRVKARRSSAGEGRDPARHEHLPDVILVPPLPSAQDRAANRT